MSTPLEKVFAALESHDCRPTKSREGYSARCLAHEDHRASLSVSDGTDGKALLTCHAGCKVETVVSALGLEMVDLFPPKEKTTKSKKPKGEKLGPVVATYVYEDESGTPVCRVTRHDPKDFRPWHPDPTVPGGWKMGLDGVRPVPYHLPEISGAIKSQSFIFFNEGEKATDAVRRLGLTATNSQGGAKGWKPELAAYFAEADVVILPDNDPPGEGHAAAVAASLRGVARSIRVLRLPGLPPKHDAFDWIKSGGTKAELEKLAAEAPTAAELAKVDGSALLDAVTAFVRRFVVVTIEQAHILAAWIVHTWAFEAADQTPYLAIISAEKRSGKTRLLETVGSLVRAPWHAVQPSEAVLYRKIERDCPTLLLDETDALFSQRGNDRTEAVRALLNAGSRRGATVSRCMNKGDDLVDFDVYCPKALAGIGSLPETVGDRSILIEMRRKKKSDRAERFRLRDVGAETAKLRAQLEAWAESKIESLRKARPALPPELGDRATDGAEPLLAIADAASGHWPDRIRVAVVALAGERSEDDDSDGVQLLADIRRILAVLVRKDGTITTKSLLDSLTGLDESKWAKYGHSREPLDPRGLANLLKPYGIKPDRVREVGTEQARGYRVAMFLDAFERYLADIPTESGGEGCAVTSVTASQAAPREAQTVTAHPSQHPSHLGNRPPGESPGMKRGKACDGSCDGSSVTLHPAPVKGRDGCDACDGHLEETGKRRVAL
jgi:hypothetical protein